MPGPTSPLDPLSRQMTELDQLTRKFSQTLSSSLAKGIIEGRNLGDVLKGVGDQMLRLSLSQAQGTLASGLNSLIKTGLSGLTGLVSGAAGSLAEGAAGHALPDMRGSAGAGAQAGGGTVIHMNVQAQDAGSFLRAEGQVNAALARAVARGQRNL